MKGDGALARLRLSLALALTFMADYTTKARYWMAILYPDRMIDDWEIFISSLLQVPYCYIIHDKDITTDGTTRKIHVHIMIAFGNTTTYSSALSVFKNLQHPDKSSCIPNDEIRAIKNIRNVYNYFIHDTPDSRKLNKHVYNKSERICGNCFDIGSYEQLDQAQKDEIILKLTDIILDNWIDNFADLVLFVRSNFEKDWFCIVKSNSGYFQAITKGMYHKKIQQNIEMDTPTEKNVTCDACQNEEIEIND